jgi:hypothetical protein
VIAGYRKNPTRGMQLPHIPTQSGQGSSIIDKIASQTNHIGFDSLQGRDGPSKIAVAVRLAEMYVADLCNGEAITCHREAGVGYCPTNDARMGRFVVATIAPERASGKSESGD